MKLILLPRKFPCETRVRIRRRRTLSGAMCVAARRAFVCIAISDARKKFVVSRQINPTLSSHCTWLIPLRLHGRDGTGSREIYRAVFWPRAVKCCAPCIDLPRFHLDAPLIDRGSIDSHGSLNVYALERFIMQFPLSFRIFLPHRLTAATIISIYWSFSHDAPCDNIRALLTPLVPRFFHPGGRTIRISASAH